MSEFNPVSDLASKALLYLASELDESELADFERRLETDPLAQEQLILAVQLTNLLETRPLEPDKSYRATVRKAVIRKSWRFSPSRMLALALVATICIGITVIWDRNHRSNQTVPVLSKSNPTLESPEFVTLGSGAGDHEENPEMAEVWAEMTNLDHYHPLSDDDSRRKSRPRDAGHSLLHSLFEERVSNLD